MLVRRGVTFRNTGHIVDVFNYIITRRLGGCTYLGRKGQGITSVPAVILPLEVQQPIIRKGSAVRKRN